MERAGRRIDLTNKEFNLLQLLMSNPGQVMSRTLIASRVWDMNFDSDTNVVDVAVRRLRQKVDEPLAPSYSYRSRCGLSLRGRRNAMKSLSLTTRLSLLIATTVLLVMILTGMALYQSLAKQISVRDDAALLNRMDQIGTLLLNEDVLALIRTKPRLFANMLGNTESLLVVRFPGQPPLIEVNPGKARIPDIPAVPAHQPLTLKNVRHQLAANGTPFISTSALAKTRNGPGEVEIITGRFMTERTTTLAGYRHEMLR